MVYRFLLRTSRLTLQRIRPGRPFASKVVDAAASVVGEVLSLKQSIGGEASCLRYPLVWLRDNCQCPSCFQSQQQSRTIHWQHFDISVKPVSVQADGGILTMKWSDGHESRYTFDWLQERNFTPENQKKWLTETYKLPKVLWTAEEFQSILRRFKFSDIMSSDQALLSWLEALAVYGVALITDTPRNKDQLRSLANRVFLPKKTHYGELFEVRYKPDTTNTAYLNKPLQMHTDLPYYEYKPGLNLLHCFEQTEGVGGENLITDGFSVSRRLKSLEPQVYHLLSTVPVEWSDIGEEDGNKFHSLHRAPVICEDAFGEVVRINYSQPQRDSHFNVPVETAIAWYKAYHMFTKELYHVGNVVRLKTSPGEILTFDNIRLIHAREGYTDKAGNERYIIGVYIDWDIAYARIRVLRNHFGMLHY